MPRTSRKIGLLLVALGCAQAGAARADEIAVVASIRPVHALVAAVMAGVGTPELLVRASGSEHSYSLRPSQVRALDRADVVFWVGETMETFLIRPLQALSGDASVVELWKAPGLSLLPTREGGMWETPDDGDEPAAADADRAAAEDHAHGQTDMHVWLDPTNAAALASAIAAALGDADPGNAATYEENAGALRARLLELDRSLEKRLAAVADRPYVVFHDAYQYFEHRYGTRVVGAITINPTVRPGARRLREIRDRLEELDAACVFAEPQFEPALVDTVIEGTSARKGVLDPLGAALPDGPDQYFRLMDNLAAALTGCLGAARSG